MRRLSFASAGRNLPRKPACSWLSRQSLESRRHLPESGPTPTPPLTQRLGDGFFPCHCLSLDPCGRERRFGERGAHGTYLAVKSSLFRGGERNADGVPQGSHRTEQSDGSRCLPHLAGYPCQLLEARNQPKGM